MYAGSFGPVMSTSAQAPKQHPPQDRHQVPFGYSRSTTDTNTFHIDSSVGALLAPMSHLISKQASGCELQCQMLCRRNPFNGHLTTATHKNKRRHGNYFVLILPSSAGTARSGTPDFTGSSMRLPSMISTAPSFSVQ